MKHLLRKIRDKYRRKLASAGLSNFLSTEDFFSFKLFLIIGFPVAFMFLRYFLEETWPLSYIPVMAIVGFFYPDIWIRGKIKNRQDEIIYNTLEERVQEIEENLIPLYFFHSDIE